MGLLHNRAEGLQASRQTHDRPNLTRLLACWGKSLFGCERPFASIQCNRDYRAKLHVDRANLGSNHVAGCGEFEGGGLYCYGIGVLNLKNRLHEFCGALPHMSLAARGRRYTVIWFLPSGWQRANPYCREYLVKLGFTLPSADTDPRYLVPCA